MPVPLSQVKPLKDDKMKKLILTTVVLFFSAIFISFGQTENVKPKQGKHDQSDLYNNFYLSYGLGTLYYFFDNQGSGADYSPGTFMVGFSRSLNKIVELGFQVSYTYIQRTETVTNYNYVNSSTTTHENKLDDNLWQGIVNIRFHYLNRPSFSMYSGFGMGVIMDTYNKKFPDGTSKRGQQILPAGQLTLMGFRYGRALSFFGEFGVGTNSIINAGISYKFGDDL